MSKLYELPNGWEWKKLGDLAEYVNGMAFKPNDWGESGLPIIRIQNLNGSNDFNYFNGNAPSKYYVKNGDILISWSASLDVYRWSRGDAILNQHIFNTNINLDVVNYDFFFHTIKYSLSEILKNLHGVGMKHITKGKFENIDVPLPPLIEQQRIVSKLDKIFEKIDKAIGLHQKNIDEADAFMGSALNEVFGELEERYDSKTVDELCQKITDGTHSTPKYTDSGVPFISVKDISKGVINFSDTKFISLDEHLALSKRCNVEMDDVLYTKVGTTGIAKVVDTDIEFSIFVSIALLKPKKGLIDSLFFQYILNSPNCYQQSQSKTRGMANRNLVLKDIKQINFPLPPLPVQQKVVAYLDDLFDKIERVKTVQKGKMDSLKALKASILDKAFRGQL